MHTLKPDPRQSDRLRGDTMKWEQVRRLASVASRYERDELLHTLPCYKLVEAAGIEPAFSVLQTDVSPLSLNLRRHGRSRTLTVAVLETGTRRRAMPKVVVKQGLEP